MELLQAVFTTLWTIWNHKNMVLHKGQVPNPLEVILTSQSLIPRYREAFHQPHDQGKCQKPKSKVPTFNQDWPILIKLVASRNRRTKRCRYAFEARKMEGNLLFRRRASSGRQTQHLAIQEALVKALNKSTELGLHRVVIVITDKKL